jgi:hypothetical protein
MSHKETTRVAIALKNIDEERLAPTHRRGDGGDDENKEPKRRVKRKSRKGVSQFFIHGVVVLAPSARTPPTPHDFRAALAMEREWLGG